MSIVTAPKAPANVSTAPAAARAELVAWQALSYVAGKQADRDSLTAGAAHHVRLEISGAIDGQPLEPVAFEGRLTIGHDSTRASSAVPNQGQVLAWILGKLNAATREAILRDLPAEFAAHGGALPEVPCGLVAEAETLLAALRTSKQVTARGPVKCEYAMVDAAAAYAEPAAPTLSVVG